MRALKRKIGVITIGIVIALIGRSPKLEASTMGKNTPAVSINICTYNRKQLLDYSLASIYKQEGNGIDFEVIIIDDGGSDDTKLLKDKYPKIRYKYFENYGYLQDGSSQAYNLAAEMSRGRVIIQQNAEAYHHSPDVIRRLASACRKHHSVFATVINRLGDPRTVTEEEIARASGEGVVNTVQYSGLSRKVPWYFCGAILRKDWNDLGGYKVQRSQVDVEFGERMIAAGYTFEWFPDVTVIHQTHPKG